MLFQYQAGPRSSYRLISSRLKTAVSANGSGSLRIGVRLDSGAVRSTTAIEPPLIPDTSACRTLIEPPPCDDDRRQCEPTSGSRVRYASPRTPLLPRPG